MEAETLRARHHRQCRTAPLRERPWGTWGNSIAAPSLGPRAINPRAARAANRERRAHNVSIKAFWQPPCPRRHSPLLVAVAAGAVMGHRMGATCVRKSPRGSKRAGMWLFAKYARARRRTLPCFGLRMCLLMCDAPRTVHFPSRRAIILCNWPRESLPLVYGFFVSGVQTVLPSTLCYCG